MATSAGADQELHALAEQAEGCRGCGLWEHATQVVFGQGPGSARVVVVGEQPGDEEDRRGEPFVGPAGRLLDRAMAEAGLDRTTVYVTNAVKHFRFEQRGPRRIHQTPRRSEVVACRPWLERELAALSGVEVVVALGATAGQALLGPSFRVGSSRGRTLELDGRPLVATVHPSSVLRARDDDERAAAFAGLVEDLRRVGSLLS